MSLALNQSWCYWGVAVAHALLLAYVLVTGGRGLLRWHLALVAAAGTLANGFLALRAGQAGTPYVDPASFLAEMAFIGSWFLLLNRLLRGPYRQSMPEVVRRALLLLWLVLGLLGAAACWYWYAQGEEAWTSGVFSGAALTAALACLALAAQLGRDAPVEGRRALGMLVAAAALAAGAQVLSMGLALLASYTPPAVLVVRSAAMLGAAALLARAVSLQPQWSLAIFVSPQARAYLPRFMAMVGTLAILLAVVPFYRSLEPATAHPLGLLLIGVTGTPVLALLFSQRLSARVRVFLSKHFLPFRYDYREEWLRLIDTLASPDQPLPLPERAIKAVAQIVGSPAGLLWMRREAGGQFACAAGWNTRMWSDECVSADDPVVTFMFERQWILDTAELARSPTLYGGLRRPAWLEQFPDALLLVPLISNQALIGFMLLLQSSSAFRLTFEEIDLLRTSGRQVAAHLAQYEADQRLAEARQFEALNRLTAFLMHDLKNLIAQQSLVVKNAARHKGNPAFVEDAIATIDNSVARMSKLLQQLQSGEAGGRRSRVRIASTLEDAVERCRGRSPEPRIAEADERLHVEIDRDRFAMVATHLIRNAQEATGSGGTVELRAVRTGGQAVITIRDDGCGMDAEFIRTRLFRPFDSTKGSKGMGIGAYQARSLVVDSGGTLGVESEPGRGTCITIRLPLVEPPAAQG
ncbi:MAG: PEP-CTERM system histidine kinase PrsK [Gammaproteobacteria bacterium]|nr:PEP-CTERM system histidine kinase PrsK [Gammaproteobacteria bacterium]